LGPLKILLNQANIMSNIYTKEAPYHPGYEDASFKHEVSKNVSELSELRLVNARYLRFADAIVDFCKASHAPTKKVSAG
jgi:hypothetical protein